MTIPDPLWPYLALLLGGVLPNETFRIAAVFLSRGLDDSSELFTWIRVVAIALLAAIVAKIVASQPAALSHVPVLVPVAAIAAGVAGYFLLRRALIGGLLAGEAIFVGLAYLTAGR